MSKNKSPGHHSRHLYDAKLPSISLTAKTKKMACVNNCPNIQTGHMAGKCYSLKSLRLKCTKSPLSICKRAAFHIEAGLQIPRFWSAVVLNYMSTMQSPRKFFKDPEA